jgi:multidrug efflux system outer membrane protein
MQHRRRWLPYLALRPTAMASLSFVAATLGGCSSARLTNPSVALPLAYESSAAASAARSPQALDQWWRLFDDPQLTQLIEQALVASPDAKSALQRIAEARATRASAMR